MSSLRLPFSAAMIAPSTWVFFSVRMSTELLPMMLVCPFTQAEEEEPEPRQFARWFFSLFSFQRTKRPGGGPGLDEGLAKEGTGEEGSVISTPPGAVVSGEH